MKDLILIVCLIISIDAFAQLRMSDGLERKVLANTCNCINKLKEAREEDYGECVKKAVMIDSIQLFMEFKAHSLDSSDIAFYAWGKELAYQILPRLIETCDKAYLHYDSLLAQGMSPGDIDSIRGLVAAGPGTGKLKNEARFLLNEGLVLASERKWESALSKFNESLAKDSMDLLCMINKGYALGMLGRGNEGGAIFEQVGEITGNRYVSTIAAVMRRKEGIPDPKGKHRP